MSMFRQRDSLNWLSLFSVSEKKKKQLLQLIQHNQAEYNSYRFACALFYATGLEPHEFRTDEPSTQKACEFVALKFMIEDTDLAKELLSAEDFEKAQAVFARKQLNNRILRSLLSDFHYLLHDCDNLSNLKNLFTLPILDQIKIAQEDEVNRSFGALKKVLDKVSSGVKNKCYFEAEQSFADFYVHLDEPLNTFVLRRFGYDFNQAKMRYATRYGATLMSTREHKADNAILCQALLDDKAFWEKHDRFCVVTFINEVAKQNDLRHAEKILSYILENLKKMPHMDMVLSNGFPLYTSMYEELVAALEERGRRCTFKRLTQYCDISVLDRLCFCYPMNNADEDRLETGRSIWNKFICTYNYPHDAEKVQRFLTDRVEHFRSEDIQDSKEIAVILDCGPFYFTDREDDERRLFRAYHPDCFTAENIWKRVYLKAHAVTLLSEDETIQFSYLQRIFIDLIKTIEEQLGICTAHQLDMSARNKHYEGLKATLKIAGIEISDGCKDDYIISLLDRDTAQMSEVQKFPELEQLGDAVYGLAVAELLFYNPTTVLSWNTEKKMRTLFEDFTRAEAQVATAKKLGIDGLFLHAGLPAKYVEYDSLFFDYDTIDEEHLQSLQQEKYLADSLEMIIGSLCKDRGIRVSMDFAKTILKKTFPQTFTEEIRPTEENKRNKDIERDYWTKILPAPCMDMESEHHVLWNALNKVALTLSLGTNDKDKRNYISYSFGNTAIYGEPLASGISWTFYDYLQNGLESFLQKYGDMIRESYRNTIR